MDQTAQGMHLGPLKLVKAMRRVTKVSIMDPQLSEKLDDTSWKTEPEADGSRELEAGAGAGA